VKKLYFLLKTTQVDEIPVKKLPSHERENKLLLHNKIHCTHYTVYTPLRSRRNPFNNKMGENYSVWILGLHIKKIFDQERNLAIKYLF